LAARHLVSREEELGAIVRLLDAPELLPRAAVLRGEAGIGKTTMWLAGIDAAAARGYRILSARPSEAETKFSFAGLTDLLGGAAGEVLPELPPIQRRALEGALLLGESETSLDDRAVAAAFLGALRLLARDSPLCLAVDDVQWLDAASLTSLRYALARLEKDPVAALLAVRDDLPAWLRRAVPEERLQTVDVGGLSLGATRELLHASVGAAFARPTLIRLWETARGNPFFALELASALQRSGGTLAPGEELPIPSDLDELLYERIGDLGAAGLAVARAAAAIADPTVSLVDSAVGRPSEISAVGRPSEIGLAETLAGRILELDGERLRFTHPLLGSAVAARQTPSNRRSLHARLAKIVPTSEERARHLALATAEPSREVASVLEEAARAAHVRGAPAAGADLAEEALRLTPPSSPDDARRRLFVAADMHDRAGDADRATVLLEQALAAAGSGSERATVLARLASVQASPEPARALYRKALSEAEGDDALQATIHLDLAMQTCWSGGFERGVEHGELAVRAASRAGDATLRCRALAVYGLMQFNTGRGIPTATMEEAISVERSLAEWPLTEGPTWFYGFQLCRSADVDGAREVLQELLRVARARNDPAGEADVLHPLSLLESRSGNWEEADRHATDLIELKTQLGRLMPPSEFPAAIVAAHRGRIAEAQARSEGAIARAEVEGIGIAQSGHGWVLGFVELSRGNANAALPHLKRSYEIRNTFMLEPAQRLELGDLLEALIAVGELDEADAVLAS
jgi:tetratricopeptide (TPR) repeat protein